MSRIRRFKNLKPKEICTEFHFLALYFLKIALLSANQNEEIFSCILSIEELHSGAKI